MYLSSDIADQALGENSRLTGRESLPRISARSSAMMYGVEGMTGHDRVACAYWILMVKTKSGTVFLGYLSYLSVFVMRL